MLQFDIDELQEDVEAFPSIIGWKDMSGKQASIITPQTYVGMPMRAWVPTPLINMVWKMVKTCLEHDGIGLAAPQVGVDKQIILCRDFDSPWVWKFDQTYSIYLNPEYSPDKRDGTSTEIEACLSCPDQAFPVERWKTIYASFQTFTKTGLTNKTIHITGYPARLFQHEYDHLVGISIPELYETQKKVRKPKKTHEGQEGVSQKRCGKCGVLGHNARTCKEEVRV